MEAPEWPDMPFAITNEIPLSVTLGYRLEGLSERASDYLSYCLVNGQFRNVKFPLPTVLSASNALNRVLNSQAWNTLKWTNSVNGKDYIIIESHVRKQLWKQVGNMTTN